MMRVTAIALLTMSALLASVPSPASAQAAVPSSGTKNAINGINSYPGPEFVKYAKEREPQDRRIDLFISGWQGSLPRSEHGSLVLRDILIRGSRPEAADGVFLRLAGKETAEVSLMGNDLTHVGKVSELTDDAASTALRAAGNIGKE